MYMNQLYTMFTIYNRVFENHRTQVIENLNEIIILATIYHLFCFTDFVGDPETRSIFVGISMLMMTMINMAINLIPVGFEAIKHTKVTAAKQCAKMNRKMTENDNKKKRKRRIKRKKEFKQEKEVLDEMLKRGEIEQ